MDNCEHMVAACAEFVSTILQRAPDVRVLATSQEVLGITGETVHRISSLTVPDSPDLSMELLASYSAVRLFVERAVAVQSGFELIANNAAAISKIARRLDGIPLAIELAAARVNVLSAEQIADRLDDAFRLLTRGSRSALPRQQTLRGALEWSYNLLSDPEKLLFNRLSVFRGGFSLEAAEEVCAGEGLDSYDVLDVLSQLISKSLVVVEQDSDSSARYRLLESMRLYGTERLTESGDSESVSRLHAEFFLSFAERAESELFTAQQPACLIRLERDYDDFRAAMAWALESEDDGEIAIKIAVGLTVFWVWHRHVGDGQEWLEQAVLHSKNASPRLRASVLARAALLHAKKLKDFERPRGWLKEALRLCQEEEMTEVTTEVLYSAGVTSWYEGEFERMSKYFEDLEAHTEGVERTPMMDILTVFTRSHQGSVAATQGRRQHATEFFEQGLVLARKTGSLWVTAYLLLTLGARAVDEAEYEKAVSYYDESLPMFHENDDLTGIACAHAGLGIVASLQDDHKRALALHQESLANFRDSREGSSIGYCLDKLAGGGCPAGGLPMLVERHNARLDLPLEEWSKEIIAEAAQRSGLDVDR
jgi:predicted ATPase